MIFIFAWNYNLKNVIYFLNEKILFLHMFVIRVHNILKLFHGCPQGYKRGFVVGLMRYGYHTDVGGTYVGTSKAYVVQLVVLTRVSY